MAKEKKIAVCKQHWAAFVSRGIIVLILIIVSVANWKENQTAAVALLIAAVVVVLYALLSYKLTYISLTETKITGHKGIIKSATLSSPLSKIQDVGIGNGLFGKIFGYHTITLSTAGSSGPEYKFGCMAKAKAFVEAVEEQIKKVNKAN